MDNIKILWFTNTPSLAESRLNNKLLGGGWIMSLENAIIQYIKNVSIIVVFNGDKDDEFEINGSKYFSVKPLDTNIIKKNFFVKKYERKNDEYQLRKYLKIIDQVSPDIIHIHGSEKNYGLISKFVDIPVVMSIQGLLSVYHYKFFSGLNIVDYSKRKVPRRLLMQHQGYIRKADRELNMIRNINYVFGRTFWDRAITKLMNQKSKYYEINRVIRSHFYNLSWKGVRDNSKPIVLVTTIRDNVYKGFETVYSAANILKESNINFIWKIAGTSTNSFLIKLFNKEYSQVKDNVELLGSLNETDLAELLCESDIYVQASHIENSPNGLAEAMLIGMPCIATYVGGTGSYISQYRDGVLIQDGDPWIMAASVNELINNEELAFSLGRNAKISAKQRHNPEKVANDITNAYRDIIDDFKSNNDLF